MTEFGAEEAADPLHRQILADFWLADDCLLRYVEPLWPVLRAAVGASGATLLGEQVHQFTPHGFTGVLLLAQSHVSLHTWVEQRLLLLDIQTCGPMRPDVIVDRLRDYLRPQREVVRRLERGRVAPGPPPPQPVPNWRSPASPRPGTM